MDTTTPTSVIRGWLGSDLPDASIARCAELARTYRSPGRACLLRIGDETRELCLVVSGRVALTEHVAGRGMLTLMTVEPGDVFGWSAIVRPFIAISTVMSLEPVEVVAIDGPRLRALLRTDHDLAAVVHARVLESLARRLAATRHQLLDLYGAGWTEPVFEPW